MRENEGSGRFNAYSDVTPIRVLEIHDGGPVVRFVLFEAAGGAGGEIGEVERGVHC